MLREETYHRIANEYGVGVGIAEWSGDFYPHYSNLKKMPDDFKVIILTNLIIREGIYQQVQRELWRLRNKIGRRRIKESTLYEKAINNVVEETGIVLNI
jgi:hypothetical protein